MIIETLNQKEKKKSETFVIKDSKDRQHIFKIGFYGIYYGDCFINTSELIRKIKKEC